MTRSSSLKSSLPFNKKLYYFPSLPSIVNFLGRCLDCNIINSFENPLILTHYFPGLYKPGIVDLYFLLATRKGATFFKYIFLIFSKESFTFLYIK